MKSRPDSASLFPRIAPIARQAMPAGKRRSPRAAARGLGSWVLGLVRLAGRALLHSLSVLPVLELMGLAALFFLFSL